MHIIIGKPAINFHPLR